MEKPEENNKDVILVIDDNPHNIIVLRKTLEASGHTISAAPNGEIALEIVEKVMPSLILLDVMMPGIDGFEVCRRIKNLPKFEDIPIIFITAKNEREDTLLGFKAGAVDYITKPFNREEVLARVKTHIKLQSLIRELQQKNNQLNNLNEEKDNFLGMASHDLRNPLSSIYGFANILIEDDEILTPTEKSEFIDNIKKASSDMLTLVNDLLDVTVIERGKLNLVFSQVNLKRLIEERSSLLYFLAQKKEIKIIFNLEEVPTISCDPKRIGQVIDNFLSNAIKFTQNKKNIYLFLEKQKETVRFTVKDEGQGISDEDMGRLFKHFSKLSAIPTGGESSHGLGLAIAKKMIDAHQGEITVDSTIGEGSEFSFALPLKINHKIIES